VEIETMTQIKGLKVVAVVKDGSKCIAAQPIAKDLKVT
jgi:hypothetical protein